MTDGRTGIRALPTRSLNIRLFGRLYATIAVASSGGMILAAARDAPLVVTLAAAAFAVAAVLVAVLSNVDPWRDPPAAGISALTASGRLRTNTYLAAVAYGWGAITMQGLYLTPVTGLKWQHGWQYALAMALLAAASWAFVYSLQPAVPAKDPRGWRLHFRLALPLAAGQALVAGGGLAALILSGKLFSTRADWAANRVFAALAVAVLAISIVSLVSHRRLLRPTDGA